MTENVEIDLKEMLRSLWKRAWIIVLCAVIVGGAMLAYTVNFVTPQYQASVTIYVNNNSQKETPSISSSDLAVALRLVNTYVNIIQSNTVLDKVIDEADLPLTTDQVRQMISAEVVDETEMFKVKATTPNPEMSQNLANAIAKVAPDVIAEIIEGSSAKIIDYAQLPKGQSSPNYVSSAVIGALVGAVLAVAVILIQNLMDTCINDEEDLEKICDVPVLGLIPDLASETKNAGGKVRR